VSWNAQADVLQCLASVVAAQGEVQIIVVDNASQDGTVQAIKTSYPQVTILENAENLGYTGGNNVGIRYALEQGAAYLLLLNDDAVLAPDAISHLLNVAQQHPEAGFLGPNVYALEEKGQFLSSGGVFAAGWRAVHRGLGEDTDAHYRKVAEVDFLTGCALLVKREAVEQIGLLDDRFFAYHEDVDWCYRAKQSGFKLLVVPQARVWHPDTRDRDVDSPFVTYYIIRNRLLFLSKHHLGWRLLLKTLFSYTVTAMNWSLHPKWRHKRPQRIALIWALEDFFKGRFGRTERAL
jgi:hypothetical protein